MASTPERAFAEDIAVGNAYGSFLWRLASMTDVLQVKYGIQGMPFPNCTSMPRAALLQEKGIDMRKGLAEDV